MIFPVLAVGCASDATKGESDLDRARRLAGQSAPVVVDSCVIRSEIGARYVLRKESIQAGQVASRTAQQRLRANGMGTTGVLQPFLCGTPWGDDDALKEIAESAGSPRTAGSLPLPLTDRVRLDAPLAAAYRQLLADIARAPPGDASALSGSMGITKEQGALLMADVGSSTLWVLEVGGTQVSAAKSMGIGMLSGVATLLTFGVGFVSMPVDGIGYQAALVDLQNQQIAWRKPPSQMRRDPGDMASYDADWAKTVFTPLLDANPASGAIRAPSSAPAGPALDSITPPSTVAPARAAQSAKVPLGLRTTGRETPLRKRPMLGDEPFVHLAQHSGIDVQLQMTNAQGEWIYVKAAGDEGWVPAGMIDSP